MAKIKIHAGDYSKGRGGEYHFGTLVLYKNGNDGLFSSPERKTAQNIEVVEEASEENVKRIGGTVGWGVAGSVLLGPVGLLAGLLLGGRGKDVTFVAKFKDGTKLLATTDSKTFTKIRAMVF